MSRLPGGARLLAGALAIVALAALLAATPVGRQLAGVFERRTAPARALGSARLRAALVRAEILAPQPPVGAADPWPGGECPPIELGRPLPDAAAPSTGSAPPEATRLGLPLVSLWLDPCRLARLHQRTWLHTREGEEVGWVSLFVDGRLRFASAVGVRLHGGASREYPPYSYRLHFRDEYGRAGAPPELMADGLDGVVERLVLAELDDEDRDGSPWPLPGETAFAIARRLGAETPSTQPVWLAIPGEPPRPASAIEQIGPAFLRRHYGHDEFDLVRGKRFAGDPDEAVVEAELAWIAGQPTPLSAEAAGERYDLESLLSWLVGAVFSGTGDLYQDAQVRDRTGAARGGRWFWIHWDHDMSFRTPPRQSRFGRFRDAFYYVVWSTRSTDRGPARALLLRLLAEDAGFRERVRSRFARALAEELTTDFLADLVDVREREARALGFADLHFAATLREYFLIRPDQVRAQVEEVLAALADPALARPPGIVQYPARRAPAR